MFCCVKLSFINSTLSQHFETETQDLAGVEWSPNGCVLAVWESCLEVSHLPQRLKIQSGVRCQRRFLQEFWLRNGDFSTSLPFCEVQALNCPLKAYCNEIRKEFIGANGEKNSMYQVVV